MYVGESIVLVFTFSVLYITIIHKISGVAQGLALEGTCCVLNITAFRSILFYLLLLLRLHIYRIDKSSVPGAFVCAITFSS